MADAWVQKACSGLPLLHWHSLCLPTCILSWLHGRATYLSVMSAIPTYLTVIVFEFYKRCRYALQTAPGQFNEAIFRGLDYALDQARRRGLKASSRLCSILSFCLYLTREFRRGFCWGRSQAKLGPKEQAQRVLLPTQRGTWGAVWVV